MFNIWPKNEVKEIIDNIPKFAWKVGPSFYIDEKEYSVGELVDYIKNLLKENKDLNDILKSIEEDGTHEHNNAIKLRQENVELKDEIRQLEVAIERWHSRSTEWEKLEADYIDRINEIDSDINRELKAEVFCLKNDYAVLKAKHQIVQNDYKKCTEQRDEFKHQLNAANKEIEALKKEKKESFDILKEAIENESKRFHKLVVEDLNLYNENKNLKKWKEEQLIVQSWWDKVDSYVRDHDDAPLGGFVANTCLNFLKERDELKAEVEKLKKDIQDYIFEKSDEYNTLKALYERAKKVVEGVEVDLDKPLDEQPKNTRKKVHMEFPNEVPYEFEAINSLGVQEIPYVGCGCGSCEDSDPKEKSWEEAVSDLALRVARLENQIKNLTSSCRDI